MALSTPLIAIKNTTTVIYITNLFKNTSSINALITHTHTHTLNLEWLEQTPFKDFQPFLHYIFIPSSSREFWGQSQTAAPSPSLLTTEMQRRLISEQAARLEGLNFVTADTHTHTHTQTPGQCLGHRANLTPSPPLTARFDSSKSEKKSVSMIIFPKAAGLDREKEMLSGFLRKPCA